MNNNEPHAGGDTPAPRKDRRGPAGETNVPPVEGLHNAKHPDISWVAQGDQLMAALNEDVSKFSVPLLLGLGKLLHRESLTSLSSFLGNGGGVIEIRNLDRETGREFVDEKVDVLSMLRLLALKSLVSEVMSRFENTLTNEVAE